jgi:LysR family nitrogen assimilation transcriptional regulator
MDIRQLRYFVTVANHENFSKAAQQLFIAQPALSRSIRALEEELEVQLFERHLRGATLTPEGRELLERSNFLLRSFDQIKSDIKDGATIASGPVVIGMTPNFSMVAGVPIAHEVLRRFPHAELKIVEAYSPELRDKLRDGGVDMALLSGSAPSSTPALAVEHLFQDRLCLIGRQGDPLLAQASLTIRQLAGLPLVLSGISVAGILNELESQARRRRMSIEVVAEVNSFRLAAQMTLAGMGYTVYSASGLTGPQAMAGLAAVPIEDLWLQRSLAWPLNRPLSRLSGEVLALVREVLDSLVGDDQWPGVHKAMKTRTRARA